MKEEKIKPPGKYFEDFWKSDEAVMWRRGVAQISEDSDQEIFIRAICEIAYGRGMIKGLEIASLKIAD